MVPCPRHLARLLWHQQLWSVVLPIVDHFGAGLGKRSPGMPYHSSLPSFAKRLIVSQSLVLPYSFVLECTISYSISVYQKGITTGPIWQRRAQVWRTTLAIHPLLNS
jgi:hypothetical protein